MMQPDIAKYNERQDPPHRAVCDLLAKQIEHHLPQSRGKIWHAHPVWFLDDNPVVGYSKQQPGIRLMFWSGAGFGEPGLNVLGKKFKDASVFYHDASEVNLGDLARWLKKSQEVQWDYAHIAKRKGRLDRLK